MSKQKGEKLTNEVRKMVYDYYRYYGETVASLRKVETSRNKWLGILCRIKRKDGTPYSTICIVEHDSHGAAYVTETMCDEVAEEEGMVESFKDVCFYYYEGEEEEE